MELVVFLLTAVVSVACAVAMVLSKNAVHSALFLVLNFSSVAVLYLLLNAPFLAMIQITVYAGAIMVLFLFVIMLLGAEQGKGQDPILWQRPVAIVLGLVLLGESAFMLTRRGSLSPLMQVSPRSMPTDPGAAGGIAESLFTTYLLPFEMTSILLLVALIGAVVLTMKSREKEGAA
ncbi:MAG: NADH-quinone oxidoreductase subunit J [Herpetosiphon sp.]